MTSSKNFFSSFVLNDWFGLLFYAAAVGLFLFVVIYFYIKQGNDDKKHEERYEELIAKVTEVAKDSAEAKQVNNLYQRWLCNVQTKVTWRISAYIAVIIGFVFTLFAYAVFVRGYSGLCITAAPPFFFLVAAVFCFFMVSGVLGWLSFHTTRPRDEMTLF
jgi:hypothetical protein